MFLLLSLVRVDMYMTLAVLSRLPFSLLPTLRVVKRNILQNT